MAQAFICESANFFLFQDFSQAIKPRRDNTDSKIHGANMGPICGWQDPGGPHVAPWTLLSGNIQPIRLWLGQKPIFKKIWNWYEMEELLV